MAFADLWVAPVDLARLSMGEVVTAWDYRELEEGALVSVSSYLISRQRLGALVLERVGVEKLVCGSSPLVLIEYKIQVM